MNSTLQCLYSAAPLREALVSGAAPVVGSDPSAALLKATRELFRCFQPAIVP